MHITPELLSAAYRMCSIEELVIDMHIGAYASEHGHTQPVVFTVDVWTPMTPPENLQSVYDYTTVIRAVERVAGQGHIELQESVHELVYAELFADPMVLAARIRTSKPQAYAKASAVTVQSFRINPTTDIAINL